MSANVQVVEVGETNSLVPNLTICVDKEENEKDVPEIQYDLDLAEDNSSSITEIKRRFNSFSRKVNNFFNPKIIFNLRLK